jgi:tetratricopeptide (TPR) repeat protein
MKTLIRVSVSVLVALFLAVGFSYGQNTAEQIWIKGLEYGSQGKFKEAKEEFEKVLKADPFDVSAKKELKVIEDVIVKKIKSETAIHLFKGRAYQGKGQYDQAIADFNKAIEINPRDPLAYNNRGFIMFKLGNTKRACSDVKRACELGGDCRPYKFLRRKNCRPYKFLRRKKICE